MATALSNIRIFGVPDGGVLIAPRRWQRSHVQEHLKANYSLDLETDEIHVLSLSHNVEFDDSYSSVESLVVTGRVEVPDDDEIVWVKGVF